MKKDAINTNDRIMCILNKNMNIIIPRYIIISVASFVAFFLEILRKHFYARFILIDTINSVYVILH